MTGLITNIQRFSVNDGPGIRTTVFMKGCDLKCSWCHNPECINKNIEIFYYWERCRFCGKCKTVCPRAAILDDDQEDRIDREACDLCMECVKSCPFNALKQAGYYVTKEDVLKEVESDRIFYSNSGGGLTVSGGEPLLQPEFVKSLFSSTLEKGIHTALDTAGHVKWEVIENLLPVVELVLLDIKHMNDQSHRQWIGVPNTQILENAARLSSKVNMRIRIPLIPGFNDTPENIEETAKFVQSLDIDGVDIIPYHRFSKGKYRALGRNYLMGDTQVLPQDKINFLKNILNVYDVPTTIGA